MEENHLLLPAKRKEIEVEIINRNISLSDFIWENHKSEELLEKSKESYSRIITSSMLMQREQYKYEYENNSQPNVNKLIHRQTQAFFTFDRIDSRWMSKYSFGKDYGIEKKKFSSLEKQVEFAKNIWLIDLIQNHYEEGIVEAYNKEKEELVTSANDPFETILTDNEKANVFYTEIIEIYPKIEKIKKIKKDELSIRQDVEKIEATIKLFGTESLDKIVELKRIKEELNFLLPQTPTQWWDSFWIKVSRMLSKITRYKLRPSNIIGFICFVLFLFWCLYYLGFLKDFPNLFRR